MSGPRKALSFPRRGAVASVYCAVLLTAFVASAGITVIYSMLPTLQRTFPGQPALAWVVTIYWLFSAVAAAVCGRLGDLRGRRRVMAVVLVLCFLGALLAAWAPTLPWLIAACAIQGAASAITPLSFGIVRENLPAERVPVAIGVLTSAGTVCAGLVFVGSGIVIDHFSWQSGFLLKAVLAAISLVALFAFVPASQPRPGPKVDLLVGVLFAPALAALLVGVQLTRTWGGADPRLWGLFALGALSLALWARHQLGQAQPLLGLRLLANRQIAFANTCVIVIVLGSIQVGQVLSLFFQQPRWTGTGLGLSATGSGLMHLALDAVSIVAAPLSGVIAARQGARRSALLGFILIVVAWSWLALWHSNLVVTLGGAALALAGYAVGMTGLYNLIIESTPPERTGEAVGLTYVLFTAFFAVGAQIAFTLLSVDQVTSAAHGGASFPSNGAYVLTFGYIAATGIVGFLLALRLPRRPSGKLMV